MKNIVLILLLLNTFLYSQNQTNKAYAIAVFDEKGNGENIQHERTTKYNYNGTCFSKIIVFGKFEQKNIEVKIGNSLGHFVKQTPIYNKDKLLIAYELTFKHYGITKGYFSVKIDNKLFDTKVFIK